MATYLLKLNGAPTPKEAERTREYLRSREKELNNVSQAICEEDHRKTLAVNAIANLESTLPPLKRALKISEDGLHNLEAVQSMVQELDMLFMFEEFEINDEPDSLQLYLDSRRSISEYSSQSSEVIDNQVDLLRRRIRIFQDQIQNMELELEGWRCSQKMVTSSLGHLNSARSHVEEEICLAKQTLHPIRRTPFEVWVSIFKYVIDEEFGAYLQHNCNLPMRLATYTLSHVCQFWRKIVGGTSALWYITIAHPGTTWSTNKYNLFIDAYSKSPSPETILINLSQTLWWSKRTIKKETVDTSGIRTHKYIEVYFNNSGEAISAVNMSSFLSWNPGYHVCIDMEGDEENLADKFSHVLFSGGAFGLVLSSRGPLRGENLLSGLSNFGNIRSLTIQNESPISLPPATLSTTLPRLECLKLVLGRFPADFQLDAYLPETLQELHIHDNNGTSLPSPTAGQRLPNLHTLGINYPARSFLESVEMPALTTLILYTFNFAGATTATDAQAVSTYKQLKHLRFQEWTDPGSGGDSYYGAMGALSRLAPHTPNLQTLTFGHCYVDGGALVELLKIPQQTGTAKSLASLQEMVLSCTEGITRDHCDELKQVVGDIKVFR
ncbi:hypothetical protein FRB91_001185 [Serendipita sp. 411]|nr:hypothetical protein FRB91_001185 [Serendipita sp. 411]